MTLFNPRHGSTIIEPPGSGNGYWAGAPGVHFDPDKGKFYLSYRLRKPRPHRGSESRIAESTDGVRFTDIWSVRKEDLGSSSIERSALITAPNGKYRLYISYVDPVDNRWRIDMVEADAPDHFDISSRKPILTSENLQVEGVKDPHFLILNGMHHMFFSYAPKPQGSPPEQTAQLHTTGDIFDTGKVRSLTGLATSNDGISFRWQRNVPLLGAGWDSHTARVTCVLPGRSRFVIFYDGASEGARNYEEYTGVATSPDLAHYDRLSLERPLLVSPFGTGSLRYASAIIIRDDLYFYYECSKQDGSHELRSNIVKKFDLGVFGVDD